MNVSNIAGLATAMAANNTRAAVEVAVLKKAMSAQESSAAALLAALPPVTAPSLPPHLGRNVNTTA